MRVGLVRNVGLSAVALLAAGLAGCDDNPLEIADGVAVRITTNPTTMILPAGLSALLESRTVDEGSRPTWEDIEATVDASCGPADIAVVIPPSFEPDVQPPGIFGVTGLNIIGTTCITLTGGGVTASVAVTVVGDNMDIAGAPALIDVFETVQLIATLRSSEGDALSPFNQATDLTWSTSDATVASVDQAGLVTTGPEGGTAVITASWTNAGVTVVSQTTINVDIAIPVLASADVTDAVGGDLITITGTGFIVGAHLIFADGAEVDAATLPTIVDATTVTLLMPLGAAGDVDFTVGSDCCGQSNAVTVTRNDIAAPVLTSVDVANADAGDPVTITATGIFLGNAVVPEHDIFVDGILVAAVWSPTVVDATTATFNMPQGIGGSVDIQMGDLVVGLSNAVAMTRDTDDDEPNNDDPSTAGVLPALPVALTHLVGMGDTDDFWLWSPAASITVNLDLSWTGSSGDLDLLFTDAGFTAYIPCYDLATGAVPEAGQCTFAAGAYAVWVTDFAAAPGLTQYLLEIAEAP